MNRAAVTLDTVYHHSVSSEKIEYVIPCPKCGTKAIATAQEFYDFPDDAFDIQRYVIAQCEICYSIIFVRYLRDEKFPRNKAKILWPQADRTLSTAIPESLRLEHNEARTCFRDAAYTATVVMVRRTLEGVCAEHGVKKMTLVKALAQMKDNGLIEGRLLEWAQELRVLGNEGAHFTGKRVPRADAADALALAEAILDYLYVFSAQFDAFKERRTRREAEQVDEGLADEAPEP